ncbi:MAG: penicillin-binding protein 2 [Rhodospirillaceae bacterium]|jgi:penicillin-binding protein 2|nr:penicillin-binding protein 2 [Rhodospirillaceae bacterium]|tara:strand:- start:2008 stop:3933 length:1926 start_codon:yes stop_codon:yes gene_type:complete
MHRDSERHKLFSRRAAIVTGGKAVLLSALVARMYYLQVVEASRYRTLAEENRINLRLLPPLRGRIVDRFGVPMADNQQNYRVLLNAEDARDVEATLAVLGSIIPISPGEKRRILRELRRNRRFIPATVRENLNWGEVARIEVNAPDLPGVNIDVGQSRYYPYGTDTAHVLGYVAAVSPGEVTGDPLLELPGFRIGKAGIEKVHDLQLRGTGGSSQVEVNAFGHIIRELTRQDGQAGAEVALTIDLELQKFASRRFKGESGAAVVMDIHNGDVLALTSTPGFDPNDFNKGLTIEQWRVLRTNPRAPLINKAVSGQFSPGSTFKMVVLLAALEKGAITPANRFLCTGEFKFGDSTFHCWKKDGHGWMDAFNGLMQSCDVYFYEVALRTGIERIAAMARRLGFGSTLGVGLPGEQPGLVPSREWKRKTMNTPWHQGETVITGIGQGYLLATPLQLAVMTARLANGGFEVTPRMTRPRFAAEAGETDPGPQFESLGLVPQHLQLVRLAMEGVVNNPKGTAFKERIRKRVMAMGGKTATVQVRRITKAEREQGIKENKDLPWKDRDHAMFVAFAPIDAPRYAAAVVVEHGGGGSLVAAPIARDILIKAQQRRSARPGILPKAPGGGRQQVMRPRGNKPGARSRDEG